MTESASNTDGLEPLEGAEVAADEVREATDDAGTPGPLEGLDDSDEHYDRHDGGSPEVAFVSADEAGVTADEAEVDVEEAAVAADAPEGANEAAALPEEYGDDELVALDRELNNLNDRHLRLAAEFNNFRRRTEQQRLETWTRAQADLVEKFLDVLDDLHRVAELDLSNASVEGIMEGVDLVERKFRRVVEDVGTEIIDPVGDAFDPERMEAMMRVPTEHEHEDDIVAQVFQKGYTLKGILVRPARVSVHKHG